MGVRFPSLGRSHLERGKLAATIDRRREIWTTAPGEHLVEPLGLDRELRDGRGE